MNADIEQGSPEWFQIRLGKVTGSRIADLMARSKSGWGASRASYQAELITERLTGQRYEKFFASASMRRGNEIEDDARAAYAFRFDVEPVAIGFVDHPSIAMAGCSPDRLVGDDGLLEIKCPDTHTHLHTILEETISGAYLKQMQWQMACTGRRWCDFVSYDPRLPEHMSMFVKRVPRDDAAILDMEASVVDFLIELSRKVAELKARFNPEPKPVYEPLSVGMMP